MSLSFSEYLIEQNLLSTDQVVGAMLIQLKSQPSNTEPIYDLRALSNDHFLKVLLNQKNENSDFIEEKNSQNELDINEESKNLLKQLMNNLTKRNNYL
ncbi:MAG: hypothetical protein DCC88_04710 [Spirobacillus cienkowskii]|uniref:Uncharacterized protein n=1 Tax=Spirobacillus cienkowskii TaxID=495820 RepID=A0A369KXZ9_9BACT|nr:MAG: hypothetical protein DCC88_04710 [Spirobacillus cienkowskii]